MGEQGIEEEREVEKKVELREKGSKRLSKLLCTLSFCPGRDNERNCWYSSTCAHAHGQAKFLVNWPTLLFV